MKFKIFAQDAYCIYIYIYMHKYQCDMPVTGQKAIANDQKTQVQINHFLMGHKKAVSKWFKKHSGTPL